MVIFANWTGDILVLLAIVFAFPFLCARIFLCRLSRARIGILRRNNEDRLMR